ncbi:MAG: hypothetical protein ACOVOQ_09840 [Flavobacterium sp.]
MTITEINKKLAFAYNSLMQLQKTNSDDMDIESVNKVHNQIDELKGMWRKAFHNEQDEAGKAQFDKNSMRIIELKQKLEEITSRLRSFTKLNEESDVLMERQWEMRCELQNLEKYFISDFEKEQNQSAVNSMLRKME